MTRRYEICVRCLRRWNVSVALDLTGKVYICPDCVRDARKKRGKKRGSGRL